MELAIEKVAGGRMRPALHRSDHAEHVSDDFGHDGADDGGNDYASDWVGDRQSGDDHQQPRLHGQIIEMGSHGVLWR